MPVALDRPAAGLPAKEPGGRPGSAAEVLDGLRAILISHKEPVSGMAFSSDGTMSAIGGREGGLRLWDGRTGRLTRILSGPTGFLSAIAFSLVGAVPATGSADETVRLRAG